MMSYIFMTVVGHVTCLAISIKYGVHFKLESVGHLHCLETLVITCVSL